MLLLTLTGCGTVITPKVFDWAIPLCKKNEGIKYLISYKDNSKDINFSKVECNNGASFNKSYGE